jgi:hypothetical protein
MGVARTTYKYQSGDEDAHGKNAECDGNADDIAIAGSGGTRQRRGSGPWACVYV